MTGSVASTYWSEIKGMAEQVPSTVRNAIASASASTGVNFSYLLAKAGQESGYNATAKASSSSASGLYQFVSQTWLNVVDKYGAKYGLGNYQKYIQHDSDGQATVKDPQIRKQILALRNNPQLSSDMAAELTKANADYLSQHYDGQVGGTELYLAHFLGAGGATQFLNAMQQDPTQSAAALLPEAAAANPGAFYSSNDQALTLGQVYKHFASVFGTTGPASQALPGSAASTQSASAQTTSSAGQTASTGAITGSALYVSLASNADSAAGANATTHPGRDDMAMAAVLLQQASAEIPETSSSASALDSSALGQLGAIQSATAHGGAANGSGITSGAGDTLGLGKLTGEDMALWIAGIHDNNSAGGGSQTSADGLDSTEDDSSSADSRKRNHLNDPALTPNSAWLTTMMTASSMG